MPSAPPSVPAVTVYARRGASPRVAWIKVATYPAHAQGLALAQSVADRLRGAGERVRVKPCLVRAIPS